MIIDHVRDINELKELWTSRPLGTDLFTFEWLINNPHLYCFYDDTTTNKLLGYIFLTEHHKNRLFLSGASIPKIMPKVINAIISICNGFNRPIYSNTDLKPAILVLKKAGFKRLRNTDVYKRSI